MWLLFCKGPEKITEGTISYDIVINTGTDKPTEC